MLWRLFSEMSVQARELRLLEKPYYARDILQGDVACPPSVMFVKRPRDNRRHAKRGEYLSEVRDGNAFVANSDTGFEVVDEETSVVYYSDDEGGK